MTFIINKTRDFAKKKVGDSGRLTCKLSVPFKGTVSRDSGQDEPMEQFRPKLMFANPFFSFKNRPL
jgi:hypothetical protein